MERILKRIAKKMGEKDLGLIMEAAAWLYWKMIYGNWERRE